MFKIIPVLDGFKLDQADPFLDKLITSTLRLEDDVANIRNVIFILLNKTLSSENPDIINGGAVLLQRKENTFPPRIRKQLNTFMPLDQKAWTGTIRLELRHGISRQDFERLSTIFYRELYKVFVAFGIQTKTDFLYLGLTAYEHLATELLENWPYIKIISPKASRGGLFYSILDLTRSETVRSPIFQQNSRKPLRYQTKDWVV